MKDRVGSTEKAEVEVKPYCEIQCRGAIFPETGTVIVETHKLPSGDSAEQYDNETQQRRDHQPYRNQRS